jgi:hypothetical protein
MMPLRCIAKGIAVRRRKMCITLAAERAGNDRKRLPRSARSESARDPPTLEELAGPAAADEGTVPDDVGAADEDVPDNTSYR